MPADRSVATSPPLAPRRRGPYAKSAAVRQEVLEACVEAFGVSGFHGTTMKDIAQRAGISQTGLMHHFPDKAALLIEVLRLRDQQMSTLMQDGEDSDFFGAQLRVIKDNEHRPGLMQLHSVIAAEATDPDHPAHELYAVRYDNLRLHLERIFGQLQADGRLKVSAEPRALANLFVASIDGLQLQWLYHPEDVDVAESINALLDSVVTQND